MEGLLLQALLMMAPSVHVDVTGTDDEGNPLTCDRVRRVLVTRFLEDGFRIEPERNPSATSLRATLTPAGIDLEVDGNGTQTRTIPLDDAALMEVEMLHWSLATVRMVGSGGEGRQSGSSSVTVEVDDEAPDLASDLFLALLQRGWAVGRDAQYKLCVVGEKDAISLSSGAAKLACAEMRAFKKIPGTASGSLADRIADAFVASYRSRTADPWAWVTDSRSTDVAPAPRSTGRGSPLLTRRISTGRRLVLESNAGGGVMGRQGAADGAVIGGVNIGRVRGPLGGIGVMVVPSSAGVARDAVRMVETVATAELGWRFRPARRLAIDLTAGGGIHVQRSYRASVQRRDTETGGAFVLVGQLGWRPWRGFSLALQVRIGYLAARLVHIHDDSVLWTRGGGFVAGLATVGWNWGLR